LGTRGDRSGWNEIAGLAASRYQKLVVQELEQQMSGPDIALTNDYLYILGKQKLQLDHDPLPPYPQKDAEQQKIWSERMQAWEKELKALQDSLYEKTAMLVASKRGRLYDLDPSEATPIILEEIQHPHLENGIFAVKGETLGLL